MMSGIKGALMACTLFVLGGLLTGKLVPPASAQVISGTISGTVQDSTGAIIPNASVVLTNQATGDHRTSTSSSSGLFSFTGLPSGDFSLSVTEPGFRVFTEKGIHLDPGDSRDLTNLKLQTGEANTVVTVQAQSYIPLDTGENSHLITAEQIQHLSVEGRDVTELLKTLPGFAIASQNNTNVNNAAPDASQVSSGGLIGSYSANGNLGTGNSLKLDGANITDPGSNNLALQTVNYDEVAEVKVETSNFGPDISQGPVVVSAVTKSGTNQFHGSLYAYARTYQLDSSDALNGPTGQMKAPDREVYPGGTLGGPVLIPGTHFNHNRALTFFVGGEDYAQRNVYAYGSSGSALVHALVPTPAMRGGDFSAAALQNYLGPSLYNNSAYTNVATVPTYAKGDTAGMPTLVNGQLPLSLQDPGFKYIMSTYPIPNNVPTATNPYNWQSVDYINNDLYQAIARVDLAISQRNHFFARYGVQRGSSGEPAAIFYNPNGVNTPGGGKSSLNSEAAAASLTTIITSTLTNQVFANLVYLNLQFSSNDPSALTGFPYQGAFANGRHPLPELGAYNSPAGSGGLPLSIIPDYTLGPIFTHKFDPEAGDNVTKVWGRHTSSFGVYGERTTNNQTSNNVPTNGQITNYFLPGAGQPLADLPLPGQSTGTSYTMSGNYVTDELEGFVGGYSQQNILPDVNLYFWNIAFFANDSWKMTPRVTVNVGSRFEHLGLWNDAYGNGVVVFNPALIASGVANSPYPGFLWHSIAPSIPKSGNNSYPLFVEPRLGVAWDIRGTGRTVLRGGWGEYRGHDSWNDTSPAVGLTQHATTVSYAASSLNAISHQNVSTASGSLPNVSSFMTTGTVNGTTNGDREEPLTDTYSVNLSQVLPSHMILELSYVGNNSRFLINGGSTQPVALDNVNAIPIGGLYKPDPDTASPNFGKILTPTGTNTGATNQSTTAGAASAQQVNEYRPLNTPQVQYSAINVTNHNLFANYNGLQVGIGRQTGRVLFNVNYTFSKALGVRGAGANNANGLPGNPFNIYNNYGSETFDRRHIFNASYTFSVGNPVHNRFIGELANGWELSGITNFQTGGDISAITTPNLSPSGTIGPINLPNVTPTTANPNTISVSNTVYLGTPDVNLQPTVICGPRSGRSKGQLINPSCFGLPDFLHNGPYQLPFLAEPAFFNSDLSAQKSFQIVHEQAIQFRISAFNFLNHPLNTISNSFNNQYQLNFTNPNGSTFVQNGSNSSLGFGTDPYKTGRRIIELMAKYSF
jgi:hypothetical protein